MRVPFAALLCVGLSCQSKPKAAEPPQEPASSKGDAAPSPAPAPEPTPAPSAPKAVEQTGPCPKDMVFVEAKSLRACVDRFEFPGFGQMPLLDVTQDAARARCESVKKRLCREEEWRAACLGPKGSAYPYGKVYRARVCNTSLGPPVKVAKAGAFPDCKSGAGAYDMSGNVSEWIEKKRYTMGGSAIDGDDGQCRYKERRARAKGRDVGFRCCQDAAKTPAAK